MFSRLKNISGVIILLCLMSVSASLGAWQFYTGSDLQKIESKTVLLEPDNWSRKDLWDMQQKGHITLAWLNLTQIEEQRLVPIDIRARDYMLSGKYRPEGKKIAVFYSLAFRQLLKNRLREYLLKGFSGVVLAKVSLFREISNSPINRSEMWRLIEELASEARRIKPDALVIIHDGEEYISEVSSGDAVSGLLVEGLFYGIQGRQVRPWDRAPRLAALKKLQADGKMILLAEDARNDDRKKKATVEASQSGFQAAFHRLPLSIEKSKSK